MSPSQDYLCPRKSFFNLTLVGQKSLPIKVGNFSYENARAKVLGNVIHDNIQTYFEEIGIRRLNELTLEDKENRIRARIDSLVEINNELYLIELKSAKSYAIHLMQEDASPNMEHIKQLQLYFHLLEYSSK